MTTSNAAFIARVLELTNEFRAQNGLPPLKANAELDAAAQGHSEDMANQDYFAHEGKNGSSFVDRAKAIGYEPATGENIAAGNGTPEGVVQDWINSPGHRANMLSPNSVELGVGYAYLENDTGEVNFGHYWTQVFGGGDTNPASNLPTPPNPEPPIPPNPEPPAPPASKGDLQAMLNALGAFESGKPDGDPAQYQAENQFGFMGKYQFGEPLLIDLGYYQPDSTPDSNDWQGNWTGKGSVTSKAGFQNAPQAQETAIREAFALNLDRIGKELEKSGKSVNDFLGKTMTFEGKTVTITLSGLLAGAHLRGPGGVADLLVNGVVSRDENGTPITQYVDNYGGYAVTAADLPSITPAPIEPKPVEPTPPAPQPIGPQPPNPIAPTPPVDPKPVVQPPLDPPPADPIRSSTDGTDGNDMLSGGVGNDVLNGGAGTDRMIGGLGDDLYIVDASDDAVVEAINGGKDTVHASGNFTLPDNVENLTLMGTNAVNGTGNGLDNLIVGNAANNYLYAGDGKDRVEGQAGDDYLYGQAGDDLLSGGDGTDWAVGDLGDDILSGGSGNDRLLGGLGNDTLAGDQGRDRLTGGAGADRFLLNSPSQFDLITDFQAAQGDKILVSSRGIGGNLKQGQLAADRFTLGSRSDHTQADFVYDKGSGRLFFDADGMGGQKQVQIAKLTAGAALTGSNIQVMA